MAKVKETVTQGLCVYLMARVVSSIYNLISTKSCILSIFHNCFHCLTVSSFQLQDVQMTMDNLETVGNKDLVALDSFVRPLDYVQVC